MKPTTVLAPEGVHSPRYSAGQGDIAPSKWSLLQVIEEIREPLGLKSTSISLLRAMMSFIRSNHISDAQDEKHICFASNAALAKRTHVSVQTIERHIAKLVSLGLLSRRSSANGKRWARRDASGRIVLATGLSLMPLSARYSEFIEISQTYKEQVASLSILRDKCAIALASLKKHLPAHPDLESLFNTARNLLRRRAPYEALTALLSDINIHIQEVNLYQTNNLRDTATENEGHKEPNLTQLVKEKDSFKADVSAEQMERAYPRLCAELRTARDQADCERRMDDIANQLGLGNLWFDIKKLGPPKTFLALGYMLERIECIEKPRGYAFHLLQGLTKGSMAWETLLKPKRSS